MRLRDTAVAALAGLLAGGLVQADPRPAPAPRAQYAEKLTQRLDRLEAAVQDAEQAAWDWRAFYRCIHTQHIAARPAAAVPVTWKTQCLEPRP